MPSATAYDRAERSTSHLAEMVATDNPVACQRQIAPRTSPSLSATSLFRPKRIGNQGSNHGPVRHPSRWLPEMRGPEEALHEVGHGEPMGLRGVAHPGDPNLFDQLAASAQGEVLVAVNCGGALHAPPRHGVETDHYSDLPHAGPPLAERSRSAPSPPLPLRFVPITQSHPYSYRDSYRDAPAESRCSTPMQRR